MRLTSLRSVGAQAKAQRRRTQAASVLAVVVAALLSLLVAPSAAHASVGFSGEADYSHGYANVTGQWQSATYANEMTIYVRDEYCNGVNVYAFLEVHSPGSNEFTTKRKDENGCAGGGTYYSTYYRNSEGIYGFTLWLCEYFDDVRQCTTSGFINNPYF